MEVSEVLTGHQEKLLSQEGGAALAQEVGDVHHLGLPSLVYTKPWLP